MDRNYQLVKRKYVIGGAVLAVVLLFIMRLFALQILNDDYKKNADSNALLKRVQYPSRGVMYDRTDKLLVYNQPAYDITVIMREINQLGICKTPVSGFEEPSFESRIFTLYTSSVSYPAFC